MYWQSSDHDREGYQHHILFTAAVKNGKCENGRCSCVDAKLICIKNINIINILTTASAHI